MAGPEPLQLIDLDDLRFLEDLLTKGEAASLTQDIEQFHAQLTQIAAGSGGIYAALGSGSLAGAAATVALPLTAGASVETTLLNNPHWNNFWIGVGGKLNDLWHGAAHFLFGAPHIGMTEVQGAINLSNHLLMRSVRQLYTRVLSRSMSGIANLARVVRGQQKMIQTVAKATIATQNWANVHILQAIAHGEHYAQVQAKSVRSYADAKVLGAIQYTEKWATAHIYQPLKADVNYVNQRLTQLEHQVPDIAKYVSTLAAAAAVAPLAKTLTQHTGQINDLMRESEECTVPMCETLGPKSDWGKLLKKYKPALFWLLLAELAALNPQTVEHIAVELGDALGPVLEHWVAAYVGILPGGTHEQPSEVSDAIGHNPLDMLG